MSELEALAKVVGSLRHARDILDSFHNGTTTTTKRWWVGSADAYDYVMDTKSRDERLLLSVREVARRTAARAPAPAPSASGQ
jgi:hypothetical protein